MKTRMIDLELGALRIQKNEESAQSMLDLLCAHLPADYAKLNEALEKKEWIKLNAANHALLGALRYCGAPLLESVSVTLQSALSSGDETQIIQSTKNLLFEIKNLIAHLC